MVLYGFASFSQSKINDDINLIRSVKVSGKLTDSAIRPFIFTRTTTQKVNTNPLTLVYGGLLYVYQNTLSQQFSANCLYSPSCSEFSKHSVKTFGFTKGLFLSADRVMRCNRIAATGIHPLKITANKVVDPPTIYQFK